MLHSKPASRRVKLGDRWVQTRGIPFNPWKDLFHLSMTASWQVFFLAIALAFVLINALFAVIYGVGDQAIANLSPAGFGGRFFFSVETLATVGYGDMHPQTLFGHLVATTEIFIGLGSTALVTGMIFARFSRPRARVMFAKHPVVTMMDGQRSLLIRAANARQNVIVDASAKLRLIMRETTVEGETLRRIYDLPLVRDQHPIFLLGWNMIHRIDGKSPLFGIDAHTLAARQGALVLTINGVDESTGQNMQARESYPHAAIRWNHRYVDMFSTGEDNVDVMDYTRFHHVEPVEPVDPDLAPAGPPAETSAGTHAERTDAVRAAWAHAERD